jgi:TRAP-type C4-dicarboxylate transport system permease small subunit
MITDTRSAPAELGRPGKVMDIKRFLEFESRLTGFTFGLACALLALAACLGLYQVATRFIFSEPSTWTEVGIRVSLIWMVMLGTVMAFRQGALVSIDLMVRMSRGIWQKLLRIVITAVTIVFLLVLVYFGAEITWRVRFQELAGLEISIAWAYLALPVGALFCCVAVIANYFDPRHMELDTAL